MAEPPLRHNRDFLALWTGQSASALGTAISSLAYPLLLLALTGSPALAGLVASVLTATTFVLRLPAGVVVDRLDRKRLMLVCDAGRLIAVGSVAAVLLITGTITIPHIVVVAVIEAAFGVLYAPAEAVAVRRVVGRSQLRSATAVNQSRQQVAGLIGPSIGGALFSVGRAFPFLADAVSYGISFVLVASIRTPLSSGDEAAPGRRRLGQELTEGLRWLWQQRFLRFAALWMAAAGLLFTSLGLITLVLTQELGASPAETGIAFTITGAGGLIGAVIAPAALRRLSPTMIIIGYAWVATAASFLLLAANSFWVVGLIGAFAFVPVPLLGAMIMAELALHVPDRLHGRAVSATTQLTTLLHPAGPALVGVLIELLGTHRVIMIYAIAFLALAIVITLSRTIRAGPPPVPSE